MAALCAAEEGSQQHGGGGWRSARPAARPRNRRSCLSRCGNESGVFVCRACLPSRFAPHCGHSGTRGSRRLCSRGLGGLVAPRSPQSLALVATAHEGREPPTALRESSGTSAARGARPDSLADQEYGADLVVSEASATVPRTVSGKIKIGMNGCAELRASLI